MFGHHWLLHAYDWHSTVELAFHHAELGCLRPVNGLCLNALGISACFATAGSFPILDLCIQVLLALTLRISIGVVVLSSNA